MGKFIKLLLGVTLVVIVVLAVAVAGALLYFDPNEHKDFIVAKVEKATGRSFAIEGNIDLTYYPWLGLEADGITMGNAKGFGDKPFVHADKMALRIKTMPLLRKTYELDTFRLHGLQLNLAKNKEGVSNWQDLTGEPEAGKPKKGEPIQLAAVILGGVDVKDGNITWQDQTTGQNVTVSDLNVTTGELTYGAPIDLKVGMKASANKPALKSDLKLNGTLNYNLDSEIYSFKPIDLLATLSGPNVPGGSTDLKFNAAVETNLDKDTATISDLSLDVLGTSIKGEMSATDVQSGKPEAEGQLEITGKDLAQLLKLLEIPSSSAIAAQPDRSFDIRSHIKADMKKDMISLPDLDASMLGTTLKGPIELGRVRSDKPLIKANIQAQGKDLIWITQLAGQEEAARQLASVKDRSFDIKANVDADLESGKVAVPNLDAKLLGSVINAKLDASGVQADSTAVQGTINANGKDLALLFSVAGMPSLASQLKDQGDRSFDIKTTLDADLGKGRVKVSSLDASLLGSTINAQLEASNIQSGSPAVQGTINARGNDLTPLLRIAGLESLVSQVKEHDRSFDIKTTLDADLGKGNVNVSNLDAKLLGATINGQVDASNVKSDKPAAKGRLKATGPDLPALMQVIGQLQGGDSSLKVYGKRLATVPERAFDISAEFDADMKSGNINVPTLSAKALGITTSGQLNAKDITGGGKLDGKFNLQGEKLSGVLAAFGQEALGEVLQKININTGMQGSGGDYALSPLQMKATFAGKQIPNSPVDLTLNANTRFNLDKQTLTLDNMSLNGLGLNLTTNVNASKILDNPQFNGDVKLAEFDLRQFASQLNQKLPKTADKDVFKKVALKSSFSGTSSSISLKDMALKLDQTNLQGDLSVDQFAQPDIKFGIAIDTINADRYLPPEAEGKPVTPETAAGSAATELPLDTLRALKINGDLQIGQLVISHTKMNNVKLSIKARDGDIRLEPVSADLYQGKYSGNVALNAKGNVPALAASTQLAGVQIEPLLKDYLQEKESPAAGVANISFDQLTASGTNADQMKQTLSGKGQFNVTDGVVRGIDVRRALEQAEVMLESKQIPKVEKGGETAFEKLTGTLDINNGVVKNKDLLMLSTGFKVNGKGTMANLKNNTIDYVLVASVDESRTEKGESTYNIGGYDVPVRCKGNFDDIASACKPDLQELFKTAVKKGALEKIGESLEGIIPGAGAGGAATQQEKQPSSTTTESQTTEQATTTEQTTTESTEKTTKKKKSTEDQLKEGIEDALKGIFD